MVEQVVDPVMDRESRRKLVERIFRAELRQHAAYRVVTATDLIKLDAMENPYGWPGELIEGWLERLRSVSLNRYPDPAATGIHAPLRAAFGVPEHVALLFGNGSDEIIQMLCMAVDQDATVMAVEPSFSMYRAIAMTSGKHFVGVSLDAGDFSLSLERMLGAMDRYCPALVFLALPNNPTANLFARDEVLALIENAPGLVVIDEAYHMFAQTDYLDLIEHYPNVLIMRTLSKMGLAGLRLGILFGAQEWLAELDKLRLPYNIGILSQITAAFALQNYTVFEQQAATIRHDREHLLRDLGKIEGITAYPSHANFILFRVAGGLAQRVFDSVKARGVLIKNLDGSAPLLKDCLRVTVGTPAENKAFLGALRSAIESVR